MAKIFLYAEYQISMPFDQIDWAPVNVQMKTFAGLKSKTWLSGVNTHSVGGFYEFDTIANAQAYVEHLLLPFARKINGNLSVRLFDGDTVEAASRDMNSPYYPG
jgi:hypothetical protein